MRLTLPEPSINLYQDGLDDHDKLDRKPMAKRLSHLVESIDDPMVIALDGGWGSGKSLFLKCWVGEHLKHHDATATLYFDAFENDYLDDPLIALTGALTDRLSETASKTGLLNKLKEKAFLFGPAMARAGLAIATYGATEAFNTAGDKFAESMSKDLEAASDAFWKREDGRRAAMAEFRTALTALTDPGEDGTPQKKLVIVIDELDRCRPDYALQLLEVIKHFFATPGIHFVLGVNLHELANSVRARYGAGIDAERYLHKFMQIRMPMKPVKSVLGVPGEATVYFQYVEENMSLDRDKKELLQPYIAMLSHHSDVTLRDIERIATLMAVAPMDQRRHHVERLLLAGIVIIQITKPAWIKKHVAERFHSKTSRASSSLRETRIKKGLSKIFIGLGDTV